MPEDNGTILAFCQACVEHWCTSSGQYIEQLLDSIVPDLTQLGRSFLV